MKTVVIRDIHGHDSWKQIISDQHDADRFIFVGDYFDSFSIPGVIQMHNFKEIIEFKETSDKEVVLLIGNHDFHYLPGVPYSNTSGYQTNIAFSIQALLDENKKHLQMAYGFGDFVFSHAGISSVFMDNVFGKDGWSYDNIVSDINELFRYKPLSFLFDGWEPHGDNLQQSCIWIRPFSLKRANYKTLRKKIIQVVGHTVQTKIDIKGKSTGGRYYFIDTLGTSREYLIIEDDKIYTRTWKQE